MNHCIYPKSECRGKYFPGPNSRPLCNVPYGASDCEMRGHAPDREVETGQVVYTPSRIKSTKLDPENRLSKCLHCNEMAFTKFGCASCMSKKLEQLKRVIES